ncbi:unnamed protein product [Triticum aestivum]|uniref:Tf2-1-like SH3-like domain-containing protein n=1 Tax=Triticum aestivum TaxID=4565 RepID=A0A7H4LMT2_WHEAT|nr:unnamed protein product [Triticum aestivum]
MKTQADKQRSPRTFEVDDSVYLKLQSYIQTSVARRANHKLAFKYYGPYQVNAKINDAAYKLDLPPHSQVHPVFHVSQLRHCLRPGTLSNSTLPHHTDAPVVPVAVLQHRWRKKNGAMVEQVRVRWSDEAAFRDTWEDKAALQARFPAAEAWGQASSQGGGDDSAPNPTHTSQAADERDPIGSDPVAAPRPTRERRPNPLATGPQWTK